jgi:hypothetical protein
VAKHLQQVLRRARLIAKTSFEQSSHLSWLPILIHIPSNCYRCGMHPTNRSASYRSLSPVASKRNIQIQNHQFQARLPMTTTRLIPTDWRRPAITTATTTHPIQTTRVLRSTCA